MRLSGQSRIVIVRLGSVAVHHLGLWLLGLDEEAIREMDQKETLSLLEVRNYRFHCGCGPERIYPIIANMNDESLEAVFGGGEVIAAGCPRCGARYTITSEALEAFRRDQAK